MTQDQYLSERVDDQIKWLSGKSKWSQSWFKRLRVLELVLASCVPFLSAYADQALAIKVLLGATGVVIAVIAGLLSLYQFQEQWIEYRATAEALKRERFMFITGSGNYSGDQAFAQFVAQVETLLGAENTRWTERAGAKPPASEGTTAPAASA